MGGRRPAVVAMLAVAFVCAGAFAAAVGKFRASTDSAREEKARLIAAVLLATAYRALTLAAPAIGALIENAMVGPPDDFPARRDGTLATFYVANRVGVFVGGIVILWVTDRERALPFVAAAAAAGLATLAISAATLRRRPEDGAGEEGAGAADAVAPPAMRWHNQNTMNYWLEDEAMYTTKDRGPDGREAHSSSADMERV